MNKLLSSTMLLLAPSCLMPAAVPDPGATVEQTVTNGTTTSGAPAVVGLVARGRIGCTGALIQPRVVLTAAHCLRGKPVEGIVVGSSVDEGIATTVLRGWSHPEHRRGTAEHDVGLLLLASPLEVLPLALRSAPVGIADLGQPLRIVGFGRTSDSDTGPPRKREGTSALIELSPWTLSLGPSPSLPCLGDSGGPVLAVAGGSPVVVGIVSKGDQDCANYTNAARIDVEMGGFIQPLLEVITAKSSKLGDRCFLQENCVSGICFAPADAPNFSYCSQACVGVADCGLRMECVPNKAGGRVCRHAGPSPGALGAPCSGHEECEFRLCGKFTADGVATCTRLCFPEDAAACSYGGSCLPIAGSEGVYGCASGSRDPT